jgi:hypothetical protein
MMNDVIIKLHSSIFSSMNYNMLILKLNDFGKSKFSRWHFIYYNNNNFHYRNIFVVLSLFPKPLNTIKII